MGDSTPILKTCNLCHVAQPRENFYRKQHAPDVLDYACKECVKDRRRRHYQENPEYYQQYRDNVQRYVHLRRTYGVEQPTYERFLKDQGGVCAICESPPAELRQLQLDHDHKTGKPRGLLCARCNTMLKYFGDRPEGLQRVMEYVQRGL